MSQADLQRVSPQVLEAPVVGEDATDAAVAASSQVTLRARWFVVPLAAVLCAIQSVVAVVSSNIAGQIPTSTLIPVVGFGFVLLFVLLINPVLRLTRATVILQPLRRAELMCLIVALMVSSGIPSFGLCDQLVPLIAAPWNPQWNTPQRGLDAQLLPYLRQELYITDPDAVMQFRQGFKGEPPQQAHWTTWLRYYWDVAGQVPWGVWLRPLAYWSIFIIGCYGIFFALTALVLDYWARREKLIFPLAALGEAVLPEDRGGQAGLMPVLVRSGLFWLGFAISAGVLTFNALAIINRIPLPRLQLGMSRFQTDALVQGTFLSGLGGNGSPMFLIIFTAIGIAFLLPLEISFSAWFYTVMGWVMILILVKMGYGLNTSDFPHEWLWTQNFLSAQGAGGLLLFSSLCVYHCVRQYVQLSRGRSTRERVRILMPVIALLVSIAITTGWVHWNHVPLFWALVFVVFITLLTLGLMRIVAESGVFYFQSHASFFHFFKMLGLGNFLAPVLVGPLLLIYSVLFLDVKTFMAPNVLNAAKIRHDVGVGVFKHHVNLIASIVVAVVVSIGVSLVLAYAHGANQMQSWFYSSGPRSFLEMAAAATTMPPKVHWDTLVWFLIGAAWVALTVVLRRSLFWWPHPIGYIMLINPLMNSLWFSFFIGWVFKKIVVKYGGKATFDRIRQVMIGLIMGELVVIFVCALLALLSSELRFGIDLNRYGP